MGSPDSLSGRDRHQYDRGKSKDKPHQTYLRDALDLLLADRPIVRGDARRRLFADRVEPKTAEPTKASRIRAPAHDVAAANEAREQEHPVRSGRCCTLATCAHRSGKVPILPPPRQVGPFSPDLRRRQAPR